MAGKKQKNVVTEQESPQDFVRRVLTSVFEQRPSKEVIERVAAKVQRSLPKKVA
jgi:hypothetical protein